MRLADFDFDLPNSLIAHYPYKDRSCCRLLLLNGLNGKLVHGIFSDILDQINPGDLLVFNNTRVIPARLYGHKASGGKIEILIERILGEKRALVHIRSSRVIRVGSILFMGNHQEIVKITMIGRHKNLFEIIFEDDRPILDILDKIGHMPLPPYIKRPDKNIDRELYQTVYSNCIGSVAAPTAGLHFDNLLLDALKKKGVEIAFITLHIGAGTFQKIYVENIQEHTMHSEYTEISQEVVDAILACKARGNKVIAVGTTSVRSLESAANNVYNPSCNDALIKAFSGNTKIFIYPGYNYKVIDALITNFHQPKSTILMLVAAFAGYNYTMAAYHTAVTEQYRFFSYGDAMYITRNPQASNEIF